MSYQLNVWASFDTIQKIEKIRRVIGGMDIDDTIEVIIDEAYPLYEGRPDDDDCAGAVV